MRVSGSIWIADVKRDHPHLRIDGLDKSLEQCPPPELCPEGCSARQLDILGDVPEDLKNVYDIVNVRLIMGGLKDDPVPALRNLIAMLSMHSPHELEHVLQETLYQY